MTTHGVRAALLALALAGCATGEAREAARGEGPELMRLDSVALLEDDTLYLGRPRDFTVDPLDGGFYVADGFANRVVRYDRAGRPVGSYGKKGNGPGELAQVARVLATDSLLLVADIARRVLNVYDRASGAFRRELDGTGIPGTAVRAGGTVWFGAQDLARKTSLMRLDAGAAKLAHLGPMPGEYLRSQPLAGIYNGVHPVAWADTLLVGFAGSAELWLLRPDGSEIGRVGIPSARRRGVPADAVERLETLDFPGMFSLLSVLFGVYRLPGGDFALVHYDQEIGDAGDITSEVWVSVLSRDRTRVCPDRRLSVSTDAQPRTTMRGDTLFVLEQTVEDQAATTFIRSYRVGAEGCAWQAVAKAE